MLIELGMAPAWVVAIIICRELAVTGLRLLLVETGGTVLAAAMPGKSRPLVRCLPLSFALTLEFNWATVALYSFIFTIYSGYDYFKGLALMYSKGHLVRNEIDY